jgi:hypothetical protein
MSDNIVRLKRKPRPLQKTYDPARPYIMERHDQEDGSITYEVWDHRPDTYRRLCSLNEWNDGGAEDDEERELSTAKADADLIVRALNLAVALGKERSS